MKKNLLLLFCLVMGQFNWAQDYIVEPIGYHPLNSFIGEGVIITTDDSYSEVVDLGFDFWFYGNTYQQLVVGSNGVITFDLSEAGGQCPWAFDTDIPDPDFQIKNAIFGPYHDIDPSVNQDGEINYGTYGTAPNRRFVLNFYEIALFSGACNSSLVTMQVILYETTSRIEVHMRDKLSCPVWNDGNAVLGIINANGTEALTPPGRNTSDSPWEATNESWRFSVFLGIPVEAYDATFAICDMGGGGIENFDLSLIEPEVRGDQSGVTVSFHETLADAEANLNPLASPYMNVTNPQLIYARVDNNMGLFDTSEVTLQVIQCNNFDDDKDGVDTIDEDLNGDGYPGNDDTDNDGIPNYLDSDDDNDWVETSTEITGIGAGLTGANYSFIDTDGDTIENYLDNDDDADGRITPDEDLNENGDPLDDDSDGDGIPEFLDDEFNLGIDDRSLENVQIIPNPFEGTVGIYLPAATGVLDITLFDVNGRKVYSKVYSGGTTLHKINLSSLADGMYLLRLSSEEEDIVKRVVKK